jgi:hypothetical protein
VTGRRTETAAFVASLGQRGVQVEMGQDGWNSLRIQHPPSGSG